ncbi:MAG TPA: hypothetical protein VFE15_09290 [Marmoricola sp.]|jgi:hypothetical protein|nr:hypothetical protein [Marmoricola sp.]
MGLFATMSRKSTGTTGGKSQEMPERLRQKLPARFEAVGEALSAGSEAHAACAVVGRDLARDGVDLSEALHGLRSTFALVVGREPDFESTRALGIAWSDETLGYLHEVSCENPLTGLATLAHLRGRISEIQRGAESRGLGGDSGHALVVVDVPQLASTEPDQRLGGALVMAQVASQVRLVFEGEESIGEASPSRLLVLVERNDALGNRVNTLRVLLGEATPDGSMIRLWIEGLPGNLAATSALLDELART